MMWHSNRAMASALGLSFLLSGILSSTPALAQTESHEGQGLVSRFHSEGVPAIRKLQDASRQLVCEGRRHSRYFDFEADVQYALDGESRLERRVYVPGTTPATADRGAESVRVYTDDYAFRLKKANPDDPYLVLSHTTDRKELQQSKLHMIVHVDAFVKSPYSLFDLPVPRLVADESFTLKSIRSVGTRSEELVEVSFDLEGSSLWYDSGRMVLAPGLGWAVREYEVRFVNPNGQPCFDRGSVEYGLKSDGIPFPSSVRIERHHPAGEEGNVGIEDVNFRGVTYGPVDGNLFSLAGYDIPELRSDPPRGPIARIFGNWIFWACLLGAVICLLLLRYRYQSSG